MSLKAIAQSSNGRRWGKQQEGGSPKKGGKGAHAEINAYNQCGSYPIRITLDAWPCDECDTKFLNASKNGNLIIVVATGDHGGYKGHHTSKAHFHRATAGQGFDVIYYLNGNCTYNAAPNPCPDHPDALTELPAVQ
jgi:hypothetical protein